MGCHFLPGDLPDPGIESTSLVSSALTGVFFFFFLPLIPPGKSGVYFTIEYMTAKTTDRTKPAQLGDHEKPRKGALSTDGLQKPLPE